MGRCADMKAAFAYFDKFYLRDYFLLNPDYAVNWDTHATKQQQQETEML